MVVITTSVRELEKPLQNNPFRAYKVKTLVGPYQTVIDYWIPLMWFSQIPVINPLDSKDFASVSLAINYGTHYSRRDSIAELLVCSGLQEEIKTID